MPRKSRDAVFALLGSLLLSTSGCAIGLGKSVHQYSLEENSLGLQSKNQRNISAESNQNVVFATSNTDFSDEAYQQLLEQCPKGRIVNITARHSTSLGFFAYKNTMRLTAVCLE